MNNNDKIEAIKRLSALAEHYMGKEKPSQLQLEMYLSCLDKYSLDEISRACTHVLKTVKSFGRFPDMAVFIEFLEGTEEDNAQSMWQFVLSEIESKGVDRAKFDEATMRACQAVGGIRAIGHCDIDKLTFKEKDFLANYKVSVKSKGFTQLSEKRLNELTKGIG